MLVSIIIPIYNVEKYVADCLQSVMRQTYRDLEVLLIDDCGTDKSLSVVRTMLGESEDTIIDGVHYRILHHEHNRGLSSARNTGIDAAKGEWVYFLDSDDWIENDCIETMVKATMQEEGIETTIAQLQTFDDEGNIDVLLENGEKCPMLQMPEGVYTSDIIQKYLSKGFYEMAWNKLIRRDFLIKHDLYFKEGLMHEDALWSFCCVCHFRKVVVIRKTLYHYRIRRGSIMDKSRGERRVKSLNTILCGQIDYIITHGLSDNKLLFRYLFPRVKGYIFSPAYRKNQSYAQDLFEKLQSIHFWTYKQLWHMIPAKRDIIPYLYRLLPKSMGLWYFTRSGLLFWKF